jgi:hypothetical protein
MLVVVMVGWMLIVFALSAVVARNDPNVEVPIEIARGVTVTPADGWYSAAEEWDVGEGAVSLQSSGVYVAFWVEDYSGANDEYLANWLDYLGRELDSFRPLPAASVTVAGDLPGLVVQFSGAQAGSGREEDELVLLTYQGMGIAMWARAQPGQLGWVQDDLDSMLRTLRVPR